MAAGRYSFLIEQGATTSFEVQYKDSSNEPIDLDGYHARMQIRPSITSNQIICKLSSSIQADGTGLNLSGSNGSTPLSSGSIGVYISAFSSSQFSSGSNPTWNEAYYNIEIVSGSGVSTYVDRILEGKVRLSLDVNRNGAP